MSTQDFLEHVGHCRRCREVLEDFYGEMQQRLGLCEMGRAILERQRDMSKRYNYSEVDPADLAKIAAMLWSRSPSMTMEKAVEQAFELWERCAELLASKGGK